MSDQKFMTLQLRTISILQNRIARSKNGWPKNLKRYSDNIEVLRKDRPHAIEQSMLLLRSIDLAERYYAGSLIGQLVNPIQQGESAEAHKLLRNLCDHIAGESDVRVLSEYAIALRYDNFPFACDYLVGLTNHEDEDVKFEATRSLSGCTGFNTERTKVIKQLIKLSTDKDQDVRDWATFGLGTLLFIYDRHSNSVDAALIARIKDPFYNARDEAIHGLALRQNHQALPALAKRLNMITVTNLNIESAGTYGLVHFYDRLIEIQSLRSGKDENLEWAMQRCHPDAAIKAQAEKLWFTDEDDQ
jgi:hypothetical protein